MARVFRANAQSRARLSSRLRWGIGSTAWAMAFLRFMGPVAGSDVGLGADEATGGKARFTSGYSSRIFIDKGAPDWALIVTIL